MSEHRILRSRILDHEESLDSGLYRPAEGTPRMVVQVFDGGSMPVANDHYFACHPVEIDGDASEGATGTPVVDTDSSVAVDVLGNRVPRPGDYLQAFHTGGRWVAESRSRSCIVRVCLQCSTDLVNPAVVGATITIRDADGHAVDSAVTDAFGCASLDINTAGDYKIRIASTGRPTTNVVRTFACGDLVTYDLCGTPCELCVVDATSLTLTLSTTTGDPLVLPMTFSAFGGGSWTAFGPGSQTFSLSCTDPQGWRLSCSYFDTTISGGVTCFLNLGGDCDGPDFSVLDLGGCTNITSSTGYTLPITITL